MVDVFSWFYIGSKKKITKDGSVYISFAETNRVDQTLSDPIPVSINHLFHLFAFGQLPKLFILRWCNYYTNYTRNTSMWWSDLSAYTLIWFIRMRNAKVYVKSNLTTTLRIKLSKSDYRPNCTAKTDVSWFNLCTRQTFVDL